MAFETLLTALRSMNLREQPAAKDPVIQEKILKAVLTRMGQSLKLTIRNTLPSSKTKVAPVSGLQPVTTIATSPTRTRKGRTLHASASASAGATPRCGAKAKLCRTDRLSVSNPPSVLRVDSANDSFLGSMGIRSESLSPHMNMLLRLRICRRC